ncbi:P-loop NTPase fold protein [Aeromonas sp. R10-1]|uniref:P-loop NTPase fold protein n=1 Tax=Aeromonas sp. R10-1 TaxID=3138457 RepID=UPI0034A3597A
MAILKGLKLAGDSINYNWKRTMNINSHVIENLDNYFELNNPEYAFLISGEWGVGKTYFVDSLIEQYKIEKKDVKIIKISLFGLKKSSDINDLIFQALHPLLGSKGVRMAGNMIKSAINFGLKVDIDGNGTKDGNINASLKSTDLTQFFVEPMSKKNFILILDDLERTEISIKEILGYINFLVEISKLKVVLISNESQISSEDKIKYDLFKEKVIGKTFEIKHDFDNVIVKILNEHKESKLNEHITTIKDIYEKSQLKNIRKIKRCIEDFEYLTSKIDKEQIKHVEFYTNLVRCFFTLNMQISTGKLNEESIRKNYPFNDQKNSSQNELTNIYELYFKGYPQLYSGDSWCDFIYGGDYGKIKSDTNELVYFKKSESQTPPVWLQLWNYQKLEYSDFLELSGKLVDEFKSLNEPAPNIYLHIVSHMIKFIKSELIDFKMEDIKESVFMYIDKYKDSKKWKEGYISKRGMNGTGFNYLSEGDKDFDELRNLIHIENEKSYQQGLKELHQIDMDKILALLFDGDDTKENIDTYRKYRYDPLFNNFDPYEFSRKLLAAENKNISQFNQELFVRYTDNVNFNSQSVYFYFKSELEFWKTVQSELQTHISKVNPLKQLILNELMEFNLIRIINKLTEYES